MIYAAPWCSYGGNRCDSSPSQMTNGYVAIYAYPGRTPFTLVQSVGEFSPDARHLLYNPTKSGVVVEPLVSMHHLFGVTYWKRE